jgi:hypothetical protein
LVGTNLDNLDEGVNPFSVVIVDHTTNNGLAAYQKAMQAALDYDDLMYGTGISLTDLKIVKGTSAIIPETPALARAMLKAFHIILASLLGDQHPLVQRYGIFLTDLDNKENFYFERLQKADAQYGPARLLRFIHLHTRAWFLEVWNAADQASACQIPLPPFKMALRLMVVDDMHWLPELQLQRTKHMLPSTQRNNDTKRQKTTQKFAQP